MKTRWDKEKDFTLNELWLLRWAMILGYVVFRSRVIAGKLDKWYRGG